MTFNEWMCINLDKEEKGYVTIVDILITVISYGGTIFLIGLWYIGGYTIYNKLTIIKNGISSSTIHLSEYLSLFEFMSISFFCFVTIIFLSIGLLITIPYICSRKIAVCKRR